MARRLCRRNPDPGAEALSRRELEGPGSLRGRWPIRRFLSQPHDHGLTGHSGFATFVCGRPLRRLVRRRRWVRAAGNGGALEGAPTKPGAAPPRPKRKDVRGPGRPARRASRGEDASA